MGRGIRGSGRREKYLRVSAIVTEAVIAQERSDEAIQSFRVDKAGLLRRFAPRNDGDHLLHHPRPHVCIRYKTRLILPEYPIAVARDEAVDRVAQRLRHQRTTRASIPSPADGEHRQRRVGFETGDAAVDHGVGVGIVGVDAEGLRQPGAVSRLDRGEAKALRVSRVATKRTQREQKMQTPS